MGIVVDEELAKATPCRGYVYNGKFIGWSEGVIGALTDQQEAIYCNPRVVEGPLPPKLRARYATFKMASETCENLPIRARLICMSREFQKLAERMKKEEEEEWEGSLTELKAKAELVSP